MSVLNKSQKKTKYSPSRTAVPATDLYGVGVAGPGQQQAIRRPAVNFADQIDLWCKSRNSDVIVPMSFFFFSYLMKTEKFINVYNNNYE